MQNSKILEMLVGLFVAAGVAGLFFLGMQVSNLTTLGNDEGYLISARFENSGKLKVRSQVSVAGVTIGRVNAIRFDKETYESVVEMRIEPQYDTLPTDTTASIFTAGLLGEQYVGLEPGGSDEFMKEGSEIDITQSALVLEEIIGQFLFSDKEKDEEK
ncbi:MAG: outer membrane lipid asymmetry maintenance protein MlaD [Gammaproteobacteria bacterium]